MVNNATYIAYFFEHISLDDIVRLCPFVVLG